MVLRGQDVSPIYLYNCVCFWYIYYFIYFKDFFFIHCKYTVNWLNLIHDSKLWNAFKWVVLTFDIIPFNLTLDIIMIISTATLMNPNAYLLTRIVFYFRIYLEYRSYLGEFFQSDYFKSLIENILYCLLVNWIGFFFFFFTFYRIMKKWMWLMLYNLELMQMEKLYWIR